MLIDELLEDCKTNQGINLTKFGPGHQILVETQNSIYSLQLLDYNGTARITGGEFFQVPSKVIITGSTWGGSCIRMKWIGLDMHLEIWLHEKVTTTSKIRRIKIFAKDWEYELETNSEKVCPEIAAGHVE